MTERVRRAPRVLMVRQTAPVVRAEWPQLLLGAMPHMPDLEPNFAPLLARCAERCIKLATTSEQPPSGCVVMLLPAGAPVWVC